MKVRASIALAERTITKIVDGSRVITFFATNQRMNQKKKNTRIYLYGKASIKQRHQNQNERNREEQAVLKSVALHFLFYRLIVKVTI